MSTCNEKTLKLKNVKYAKLFEVMNQRLKLVKDKDRADHIRPTKEKIENQIYQLSRKDVSSDSNGRSGQSQFSLAKNLFEFRN